MGGRKAVLMKLPKSWSPHVEAGNGGELLGDQSRRGWSWLWGGGWQKPHGVAWGYSEGFWGRLGWKVSSGLSAVHCGRSQVPLSMYVAWFLKVETGSLSI